jgi:hypothetical protein
VSRAVHPNILNRTAIRIREGISINNNCTIGLSCTGALNSVFPKVDSRALALLRAQAFANEPCSVLFVPENESSCDSLNFERMAAQAGRFSRSSTNRGQL